MAWFLCHKSFVLPLLLLMMGVIKLVAHKNFCSWSSCLECIFQRKYYILKIMKSLIKSINGWQNVIIDWGWEVWCWGNFRKFISFADPWNKIIYLLSLNLLKSLTLSDGKLFCLKHLREPIFTALPVENSTPLKINSFGGWLLIHKHTHTHPFVYVY